MLKTLNSSKWETPDEIEAELAEMWRQIHDGYIDAMNEWFDKDFYKELVKQVVAFYNSNDDKTSLCDSLAALNQKGKEKILVQAFKKMIENHLDDGNVDENEASRIISYFNDWGLPTNRMMKEMELVYYDLHEGVVPRAGSDMQPRHAHGQAEEFGVAQAWLCRW